MAEPNLDFTPRYRPTPDGLAPGGRLRSPLMTPLVMNRDYVVHGISDVGKVSAEGMLYQGWDWELAPMSITAAIVQQSQGRPPTGTTRNPREFPYGLKAVGFVNAWDILYRQGRLTSDRFEIVP